MTIIDKTRKILWGNFGNRCAICRKLLIIDATKNDNFSVVGEECHIISGKVNGPRYKTVEIYIDNERVAAYIRNYNTFKRYTTLSEHMPEGHQAVSGWSSERFLSWAETIGPNTCELIKHLLESHEYESSGCWLLLPWA